MGPWGNLPAGRGNGAEARAGMVPLGPEGTREGTLSPKNNRVIYRETAGVLRVGPGVWSRERSRRFETRLSAARRVPIGRRKGTRKQWVPRLLVPRIPREPQKTAGRHRMLKLGRELAAGDCREMAAGGPRDL